jgi:cytochrome c oxidase subunit 4
MATTPLTSQGGHHVTPPSTYIKTLIALLILMASTVAISYWRAPSVGPISGTVINNLIAMAIAITKALLVIMFFMGVKYSSSLTKLFVAAGFVMLFVMFGIIGDNYTRSWEPIHGWGIKETALPRNIVEQNEADAVRDNAKDLPPAVDLNVRIRQ